MSTGAPTLSEFEKIFEQVYGIQLAGTFVACALYGILGLQVFIYYMNNPKDPFTLKALPAWLLILETVHQFVYCVGLYRAAVVNFGNPNIFSINIREVFVATIFQGFITVSAHLFFVYRIWKFGQKLWIVPIICIPLTTFQLALVIAENSKAYVGGAAILTSTVWMTYTAHSINIFLDATFVGAMIWLLKKENNSAFKRTNNMINRLVVLTINTGLATTISTFLTIILFRVQPGTLNYVFFNILISPFYCNSVMANLNSRDYVRGKSQASHNSGGPSSEPTSSILELGKMRYGSRRTNLTQPSGGSVTQVGRTSDFEDSEFATGKGSFINVESHVTSTQV